MYWQITVDTVFSYHVVDLVVLCKTLTKVSLNVSKFSLFIKVNKMWKTSFGPTATKLSVRKPVILNAQLVARLSNNAASMGIKDERHEKSATVIGGGVMGLGTAFHLAERGYKVKVLEKAPDIATVKYDENYFRKADPNCVDSFRDMLRSHDSNRSLSFFARLLPI